MKPIIGIVSRPGIIFDKFDVQVMEETYKNAILKSGGIPIMITPPQSLSFNSIKPSELPRLTDEEKFDLDHLLSMCDGILSPGGLKTYEYDYYICKYAKENNIPMLGICAGMQIMTRIDSEIKIEKNNLDIHKSDKNYAHEIRIKKETLLYEILKQEIIKVNSFHNFHVSDAGNNYASAISIDDGIIEAIENYQSDFYLGVQWHPEKMIDYDENSKKIFDYFINKSKKNKLLKRSR